MTSTSFEPMAFSSIVRALGRSRLQQNYKLNQQQVCSLNGIPRLPGMASALAQTEGRNLLVVCATLEEAGRWAAQLENGLADGTFYPTSEGITLRTI